MGWARVPRLLVGIVISIVAAAIAKAMVNKAIAPQPPTKEQIQETIEEIAQELAKQAPMRVDEKTVLIGASYGELTLRYLYRIEVGRTDRDLPDWDLLRESVKRHTCENLRESVALGITVEYVYQDVHNVPWHAIAIAPNECGGK
jgi:hypothetical protein